MLSPGGIAGNGMSPSLFTGDARILTQDCRQCGRCCEKWGWDQKGITDDLEPWITGGRNDILNHVLIRFSDGSVRTAAGLRQEDLPRIDRIYYWVDPGGKKRFSCPFFERRQDGKVYCRIHDTKPAVCVGFAPWAALWHDYGLNCPACRQTTP
jgi:Fe-S-cluster containining protein